MDSKLSEASKLEGSLLGKRKNEKTSDYAIISLGKTFLNDIFEGWPNTETDETAGSTSTDKEEYSFHNGYYSNYYQANLQILDRKRLVASNPDS